MATLLLLLMMMIDLSCIDSVGLLFVRPYSGKQPRECYC